MYVWSVSVSIWSFKKKTVLEPCWPKEKIENKTKRRAKLKQEVELFLPLHSGEVAALVGRLMVPSLL